MSPARDDDFKAVARRRLVGRVDADDEKAGIGLKQYSKLQTVKLDVRLGVIQHAQEEQQEVKLRLELLYVNDQGSEKLCEVENVRKRRWEATTWAPTVCVVLAKKLQATFAAAAVNMEASSREGNGAHALSVVRAGGPPRWRRLQSSDPSRGQHFADRTRLLRR